MVSISTLIHMNSQLDFVMSAATDSQSNFSQGWCCQSALSANNPKTAEGTISSTCTVHPHVPVVASSALWIALP